MTKSSVIKIIDLVSFISLSLMLSTGVLIRYSLPPRSGGSSLLGLTRHDWGDIHYYASILFLVLTSLHLLMHLSFINKAIVGKVEREVKYRLALGMLSIVVLVALLAAPFFVQIENSGKRGAGKVAVLTKGVSITKSR